MKEDLVKTIQSKKVRDYTYAIAFFLVASFFAVGVIRPVLGIAISIRRQGEDLRKINATYEKNIGQVLELQSQIEEIRPKRYLLDDALPPQADLSGFIADIQRAGAESGVTIVSVDVDPIALKSDSRASSKSKVAKQIAKAKAKQAQTSPETADFVGARITVQASYEGMQNFLQSLLNQRRIKQVSSLTMNVEKRDEDNPEQIISLNMVAKIQTYYLAEN